MNFSELSHEQGVEVINDNDVDDGEDILFSDEDDSAGE